MKQRMLRIWKRDGKRKKGEGGYDRNAVFVCNSHRKSGGYDETCYQHP